MFSWPSKLPSYPLLPKFNHFTDMPAGAGSVRLRLLLSPFTGHDDKITSWRGCLETFLEEGCSTSGRGDKVSRVQISAHTLTPLPVALSLPSSSLQSTACNAPSHTGFLLNTYLIVGSWVTRQLYF